MNKRYSLNFVDKYDNPVISNKIWEIVQECIGQDIEVNLDIRFFKEENY